MTFTLRNIHLAAVAAVAFMLASLGAVEANDAVDKGPKVGETVPYPIEALDQTGMAQTFDTLKGDNGLILLFNRSVDWCPYCQNQVIDWNKKT